MGVNRLSGTEASARIELFLQRFFSPPNELTLAKVEKARGPAADNVRLWMDDLRQEKGIVLLPCLRNGRREWYGLAFSERQQRALQELVGSFIGPSYSTFRGGTGGIRADDPIDASAMTFTGGHVVKFVVPEDASAAVRTALQQMRVTLRERPALSSEAPRATGRILRDYYMALRAGDRSAAERHWRSLEAGFRLDPVNLLFLRVQALAEFGEWKALLALPELGDLLSLRRPPAVSRALLTAVYHVELASFEAQDDPDGAAERFRSEVYPRFASLLTSRSGLRSDEAQRMFMLLAVAGPQPSAELRDQILGEVSPGANSRPYLQRLASLLPAAKGAVPPSESLLARAEYAAHRGLYDEAFRLALELSPSPERARVLLDSAYGLSSIESGKAALAAIGELPENDRASVLADRRRSEAYQWLVAQAPERGAAPDASELPGNWFEWLTAIEEQPGWPQAVQLARRGAAEWTIDEFLDDPRGPAQFGRRLTDSCTAESLRLALPHLLEFFQGDPKWPRLECTAVYKAMMDVLVFTSAIGDEDLTVFHQLAEALLSLGSGMQPYAELVGYAQDLLQGYSAPTRIDWALDMLDLFLAAPCPSPEARLAFAASVAGVLTKYALRVTAEQRALFASYCDELGHRELFPAPPSATTETAEEPEDSVDPLTRLGTRSVAIYTLTENAARRMTEVLKRYCPSAAVETSHEHVASERLKHLARNADVFVMATASAKHAATLFIQSQRPSERPLLRPAGKGTASMLRVLRDYAAALA